MDDEKSKWLSGQFDMETVKAEEMLTVLRQRFSVTRSSATLEEFAMFKISRFSIPDKEEYWKKLISVKFHKYPGFG
jgi:hypothetical protein